MESETTALTPDEQKYFDTRGTDLPGEAAPVTPEAAPGAAGPESHAADVPAGNGADEADGSKNEGDNPGKFVRHGAFHEERERRKELQAELARVRHDQAERDGRLQERLNMLQQAWAPQQEAARIPTPETDALGTLKYVSGELQALKQQQAERQQQETQYTERQQQHQAFEQAVKADEAAFQQTAPDYLEAVEFAKETRLNELREIGYNETRAQQILFNDIIHISTEALNEGRSPAQAYYNFAKYRGFAKQAAPPKADPAAEAGAKLKNIAAGQAAGKSLGSAPGSSAPGLTLETIANMSNDDFAAIALDKKQWRKVMGG